ncbi:MAG: TonB-dependent receptor plug domain-containing protein [Rhodocyclaceae bacterium]
MALLAFGSLAWADEGDEEIRRLLAASPEELMTMSVSIATQSPQSLSKAPAVVSVITAEDIKATGATNFVEVLQGVPGIYLRINQFGFRPLVSMRGAASKNALIMVNGAPLRDLVWATGIFWRGLPVAMIERIEVIRGPASALYGSDASSGVINVITKTAGKMRQSEAGVRIGSFDTQSAWLNHGGEWNGLDIGLSLDASTTAGHRPHIVTTRNDGQADHANLGYDNVDARLSVAQGNWRVLADHMQKSDVGIGVTGGSYLDPQTQASDRLTGVAWLYSNPAYAQDWGLDAELRYRDMEYSSGNGFWERTTFDVNQLRSAEQRFNAELSGVYTGFGGHELRIGSGYVWQDVYFAENVTSLPPPPPDTPSFTNIPQRSRSNSYLFVQDVWNFAADWELTAGVRYDRYIGASGAVNPRAALVWQTTDRLTSKLIYGRAFRMPSFLELYVTTNATTPNPNLAPEKSTTWEVAFNYRLSRDLNLGANLFRYHQANPIVDISGVGYRNVAPHTIRGIELEAVWQATRTLRISGNATFRKADQEQYVRLGIADHFSVPNRDAYLRADWAFLPKWSWNFQANHTGRRSHLVSDTRGPLRSQTVADTTIRYYHGSEWEFAASIRNLFDEDAREYSGRTTIPGYLPMPRRNMFVEARYKF